MKKQITLATIISLSLIAGTTVNTLASDSLLDDILNDTETVNTDNTKKTDNSNVDNNLDNLIGDNTKQEKKEIIVKKIKENYYKINNFNKDYIIEVSRNNDGKYDKDDIVITDKDGNKVNFLLETDVNTIKKGQKLNKNKVFYIELDGNYDEINLKLNNFIAKRILLKENSDILGQDLKTIYTFNEKTTTKKVEKELLKDKKAGIETNLLFVFAIMITIYLMYNRREEQL